MEYEEKLTIRRVVNALLIAWFVITPLFWSLNLSKGTYGFYDTFNMAPYSVFHAAIFYLLMLTSIHISKCSLLHVLLLTLYFPCITLINYPYLTFRDVYLHGAPAETILEGGKLNYLRDPTAEYWPSSFILNALSAVVLGCDLVTANYILFFGLILALALVTYSIANFLEKRGYLLALATAPLFVALFYFNHYARCHHSFILIFYLLFSFIRLEGRRGLLLQLLLIISIVPLHPFNSLYVTIFSFSYVLLTILYRKLPRGTETALFSSVAFLGWWLFQAGSSLEEALPWIKAVLSPKYIEPVSLAPYVLEPLPLWGVILRSYWKYSLLALLIIGFLSSIVLLLRHLQKRKNASDMPTVIITLTSVLAASGLFFFIMLLLPEWSLSRFTMYAAFPAAFTSLICLEKLIKINRKKTLLNIKAIAFILLIFIISLSFTTLLLLFESNIYFNEMTHPSEFKALSFLFTYEQSPSTIVASPLTSFYSYYFDYNSVHRISYYPAFGSDKLFMELISDPTKLLPVLRGFIDRSDFVVRGMRDKLYLSKFLQEPMEEIELRLKRIDIDIILPNFNRVYDNGYYHLFRSLNFTKK